MFNKDKKHKENNTQQEESAVIKEEKHNSDTVIQIKKSEIEKLEKELADYKNKLEDSSDRYLRLQAEFDNAKKRMQREQQEFVKYANEGMILELLGILDDLERSVEARETNHQDPEAFLKGIEMILSHIYEMLKKNNVKPIEAKGKIFDPHLHEALMQAENDQYPENTIIEELQKGYMLGERVIRTAKVQVSKKPHKKDDKEENIKEEK
ncbi:MAG: nucleotide exchange factor GrpE [Candidatus Omnitrophica bacterium]|nr:nucleotide exchange factor GrpE [Candidatus Omnitrophota bacterium]MDD5352171.1 nucleotide exchange factor GrpE [Candidatus Omnitrophota bacterium]MDD5549769.1 nucleotide exchange factor GrpE [Candidatus Omnitrophota bacterium]